MFFPSHLPFWEERGMFRDDASAEQSTAQLNRDICLVKTASAARAVHELHV